MGVMLEKSRLSEDLLDSMADLFRGFRSGLGLSVVLVGALLAASTGIVGATVVTMGLMSLPTHVETRLFSTPGYGYYLCHRNFGQIIPPSIALVLLGDILSSAYQQAQLNMGIFTPKVVSIGDLFVGAIIPGLILVALYSVYVILFAKPQLHTRAFEEPLAEHRLSRAMRNLIPPIFLIAAVLGSILTGAATPTEAAGVGAFGATMLAMLKGQLIVVPPAGGSPKHHRSHFDGVFDLNWRDDIFIGISWVWR